MALQGQGASGGRYLWQKTRRRADAPIEGKLPVQGFGPDGRYTLWLVSPVVQRKLKFSNGKPAIQQHGATLSDPQLMQLRSKVVDSLQLAPRDHDAMLFVLRADLVLAEYAAYVIALDYSVSDDDLDFLLSGSTAWIKSMAIHACGGQEAIDALSKVNPAALAEMLQLKSQDESGEEIVASAPVILEDPDEGAELIEQ